MCVEFFSVFVIFAKQNQSQGKIMYGITIDSTGSTSNMKYKKMPDHPLESGEVKIKHTAIGVNYIDIYYRTGLYKTTYPATLGIEAAGIIEEVGPNCGDFKVGDRVAYGTATSILGAYSTYRNIPAQYLVPIPDYITDEQAATIMVKGMTAHFLLRRVYVVQQGQHILIHAAAGGVGTYMCQWANYLGCKIVGTVSSKEKADWASENGCTYPVIVGKDDFVIKARHVTEGKGVTVCYDSVGKDTFKKSLECLMPYGLMVSFGQSSGRVPPIDVLNLARGSLFLTRPTLNLYKSDRNELFASANEIFEAIKAGALKPKITEQIPLKDAAKAHKLLESRKTMGSIILKP